MALLARFKVRCGGNFLITRLTVVGDRAKVHLTRVASPSIVIWMQGAKIISGKFIWDNFHQREKGLLGSECGVALKMKKPQVKLFQHLHQRNLNQSQWFEWGLYQSGLIWTPTGSFTKRSHWPRWLNLFVYDKSFVFLVLPFDQPIGILQISSIFEFLLQDRATYLLTASPLNADSLHASFHSLFDPKYLPSSPLNFHLLFILVRDHCPFSSSMNKSFDSPLITGPASDDRVSISIQGSGNTAIPLHPGWQHFYDQEGHVYYVQDGTGMYNSPRLNTKINLI